MSHRHRLLFVHIPKCAGTTIESILGTVLPEDYFTKHGMDVRSPIDRSRLPPDEADLCEIKNMQHFTIRELAALLGPRIVREYFTFTVVRNPYTRLVSEYFHCKSSPTRLGPGGMLDFPAFPEFVTRSLALPVRERILRYDGHLEPQAYFTVDAEGSLDSFDRVYRFERLSECLRSVRWRTRTLRGDWLRRGRYSRDFPAYYDGKLMNLVRDFYQKDFELFGYDPDVVPTG